MVKNTIKFLLLFLGLSAFFMQAYAQKPNPMKVTIKNGTNYPVVMQPRATTDQVGYISTPNGKMAKFTVPPNSNVKFTVEPRSQSNPFAKVHFSLTYQGEKPSVCLLKAAIKMHYPEVEEPPRIRYSINTSGKGGCYFLRNHHMWQLVDPDMGLRIE